MDQIKPTQTPPQQPTTKPLSMVETYQRQWNQLVKDMDKQLDKINRKLNPWCTKYHMQGED